MPGRGILIVEDDPGIRETLKEILKIEGYCVSAAENGRVALDRLSTKGDDRPCMILLDLMMPVMDGWEFLETLQTAGSGKLPVPVAVISAAADLTSVKHRYGCEVLTKPVDIEDVLDVAQRHCPGC